MQSLDLFAGIGGFSLGLERAGIRTVAACELDAWKRERYRARFPGVPVFRDVRKLTGDALRRAGLRVDLVAGSPPCQDASAANTRGLGIDGPETGLFREAVRLVRELRPRWALFENSPRMRTRGVDRVLGWLEAADYAVWPLVVGADDVGAPHERKRMWLVAHANGAGCSGLPGGTRDAHAGAGQPSGAAAADAAGIGPGRPDRSIAQAGSIDPSTSRAHTDRGRLRQQPGRRHGADGARAAIAEPPADADRQGQLERAFDGEMAWLLEHPWAGGLAGHLRVADGVSAGLARQCRSAYGDAVVPLVPELLGRAILAADRREGST